MMDITVNELTRRGKTALHHHIRSESVASTPKNQQEKAQAFSYLSCCAVKVGDKRQRNEYAAETCNTDNHVEQNNRRGSNDNGCAERGEESVQPEISDPKFYDFDKGRADTTFAVGQTWALYDKTDGMPRLYAQIRKVSAPSFGLRITYLEPDPDDEKEIQWFEEDLPVSAGKFRLGKNENTKDRSKFSHIIQCNEESNAGQFTVSPRRGETWALFKNWDINWSSEPDSHRNYEYEFVEILSDYSDETGVYVSYLHKAKGFASVFFRMGTGPADIFRILPHSLYQFSHSVPSFKLTGTEGKDVLKDAYELDQAALPKTIKEIIVPSNSETESDRKPKSQDIYFASKGKVFQTGQIWSFYSSDTDLPLYYCKIQKITFTQVLEQEPVFKLHVSRLKKATPFPEDVIDWIYKKMPIGCGTYYPRTVLEIITPDELSHQAVPQISMDGKQYTILPKVGEVWAIYRQWTHDIEFEDLERVYCAYDLVEVLDDALDYKVLLLEYKSLYGYDKKYECKWFSAASEYKCKYMSNEEDGSEPIFTIPKSKRLRFSHKVPASRIRKEIHGDVKDLFRIKVGSGVPLQLMFD